MKSILRIAVAGLLFVFSAIIALAQTKPGIDDSNLLTTLLSISLFTPKQADAYFVGKHYTVFSRTAKDMGGYQATTIKYKMVDNTDYFSIITVKETIISTMYITHSKEIYQQTLANVSKMGFKETTAIKPYPAQTVYEKDDNRFLVRISTATEKPLYVMAANNLLIAGKAIMAEKKANKP